MAAAQLTAERNKRKLTIMGQAHKRPGRVRDVVGADQVGTYHHLVFFLSIISPPGVLVFSGKTCSPPAAGAIWGLVHSARTWAWPVEGSN
jgi:hypothetical protein